MIIQEEVEVVLNGANMEHFESLGYYIPVYKNYCGRMAVKRGLTIKVKVKDLSTGSHTKVLVKCDNSNCDTKPRLVTYQSLGKDKNTYLCKYCSKQTKEFKDKLRKARKGTKLSEETRRKVSEHNYWKGKTGVNSFNWNSDKTNEERMRSRRVIGNSRWRKDILIRDNYTCQCCGSNEHLQVHHIDNWYEFPEKRLDINNGITLCLECHQSKNGKSIHNIYGKFITKENFDEFMKNYKRIFI